MNNNLDESWKYVPSANISPIERIGRNNAYRQGIDDFRQTLIKKVESIDSDEPIAELIKAINDLKA